MGHASLVGLLGLSPSYLVSAAADSTLRVWDPDSGDLRHILSAHTGAITCFQHDEFKVLSGSDGTLKMWDIRDGSIVRDLLTGIIGVWQVVFEGRWCVAASNRMDSTMLDVWDFGNGEEDDEWLGEPAGGCYDDDETDDEDEDEEMEQADADAMDQDLDIAPSEAEMAEDGAFAITQEQDEDVVDDPDPEHGAAALEPDEEWTEDVAGPSLSPSYQGSRRASSSRLPRGRFLLAASTSTGPSRVRHLPSNEETPTRARVRPAGSRRR